jgi:ubiquinone/menaquinone biosynthesis C-methylase UbiE
MDWGQRIETMTSGYRDSCILVAALKVGIFEALGERWRSAPDIAAALVLDARAVDVVMCALVAAEVLRQDGDLFAIEPDARPFLLREGEATMASIIGHNLSLMKNWVQLDQVLRTGKPAARSERTTEEMRDFICGMADVSRKSSEEVAAKVDLTEARRLLDLGGGPGTAALTFARANPGLHCVVYDLPGPIGIAVEQIKAAGLEERVTIWSGDFLVDPLGEGFDVVYISNIIHMLDPAQTLLLLEKGRAALTPGGRIMVKDFFLDDARTSPAWTAQFSVNMLVGTAGGKSYTFNEMLDLMGQAGFADCHTIEVARNSQVISGRLES